MKEIENIKSGLSSLNKTLNEMSGLLKQSVAISKDIEKQIDGFYNLVVANSLMLSMSKDMLLNYLKDWPVAVDPLYLPNNSVEKQMERAQNIVEMFFDDLHGKKVLDFGCGLGYVTKKISETAKMAVGFDIEDKFINSTTDNLIYTTNFENVLKNGPYDIVLLYDVIDHYNGNLDDMFSMLKTVSNQNTLIYLRCHPWSARHGGHIFGEYNKAFIHLLLSDEELGRLNLQPESNIKVKDPIGFYNNLIKSNGFDVVKFIPEKELLDDFFVNDQILVRRFENILGKDYKNSAIVSFCNYTIKPQ